jgi:hypothetical protein
MDDFSEAMVQNKSAADKEPKNLEYQPSDKEMN